MMKPTQQEINTATAHVRTLSDSQLSAMFEAAEKEMVDRVLEHRTVPEAVDSGDSWETYKQLKESWQKYLNQQNRVDFNGNYY